MRDGVHTIPVPNGWSPEQAWEAIRRGDLLSDPEPSWVNIIVRCGKFVDLHMAQGTKHVTDVKLWEAVMGREHRAQSEESKILFGERSHATDGSPCWCSPEREDRRG